MPLTLKLPKPNSYVGEPRTLGEHLRKRRRALGLRQRDVAKRLKVNYWTYRNWEVDEREPSNRHYRDLIDFLGFDPAPAAQTIPEAMKAARKILGLSQRRAARQLGWSVAFYEACERGRAAVSPERLRALSEFLAAGV